ncbi:glucosamine-6-phosphate deaminase [Atlantibacter subterranea]|uniref:glucosamine-6-phosphate deaminase n=1 Tax=Atlantibacter subterraneus TaxID=255519 RepID=UPI00118297BF|nr:glucosamine-6-phosphate deaminase [Atlantibacter subterranea]TSJ55415.1 glucosamine-6-phosphate deaminase [Atlantibacter subterranea]
MKVYLVKDYDAMSWRAYEIIADVINNNPHPVISMTTGASPTGLFRHLTNAVNEKTIDISEAVFLNVDEYVGGQNDVYTVHTFMFKHFYDQLKYPPKYFDMFNAGNHNKQYEILRYKHIMNTYPRDLQLLGLGVNGHIGACEPGTPFNASAFCAQHKESTIESTMNLYGITREQAPTEMFTLGFKEIMDAKIPLLIASGKSKAQAVKRVLEDPINEDCPASCLRNHPSFTFVIDHDAASLLSKETLACITR